MNNFQNLLNIVLKIFTLIEFHTKNIIFKKSRLNEQVVWLQVHFCVLSATQDTGIAKLKLKHFLTTIDIGESQNG